MRTLQLLVFIIALTTTLFIAFTAGEQYSFATTHNRGLAVILFGFVFVLWIASIFVAFIKRKKNEKIRRDIYISGSGLGIGLLILLVGAFILVKKSNASRARGDELVAIVERFRSNHFRLPKDFEELKSSGLGPLPSPAFSTHVFSYEKVSDFEFQVSFSSDGMFKCLRTGSDKTWRCGN